MSVAFVKNNIFCCIEATNIQINMDLNISICFHIPCCELFSHLYRLHCLHMPTHLLVYRVLWMSYRHMYKLHTKYLGSTIVRLPYVWNYCCAQLNTFLNNCQYGFFYMSGTAEQYSPCSLDIYTTKDLLLRIHSTNIVYIMRNKIHQFLQLN